MKRFMRAINLARANRLARIINRIEGTTNGVKGTPPPGQKPHPRMPDTWDGTGETPPGWTAPTRPVQHPRFPGEYMVHCRGRTARRIENSTRIPVADRAHFKGEFDKGDSVHPDRGSD